MNQPAYRISINKSVDRCLFMDLIHFLETIQLIKTKDAEYYSLGGPFLIDLKQVHSIYPFLPLNSIEEDTNTFLRQKFHKFCKKLKLHNKTSSDFISQTDFNKPAIFWLDYTKLSNEYLNDVAQLANKLPQGSIIKVTFNVSPPYKTVYENKEEAVSKFNQKYHDYLPATPIDFSNICESDRYKILAFEMVKNAIDSLLRERKENLCFEFCDVVTYSDICPMMSLSGILLSKDNKNKLIKELAHQRIFSPNKPQEINMPDLSIFERHKLNKKMPSQNSKALLKTLGYPLCYGEQEPCEESLKKLILYSRFWHKYPEFVKVNF